jgi:hypothetical protein
MKIKELMRHKGKKLREFHRHPNGGGWVENTAKVAVTAMVAKNALVYDYAWVMGNSAICDNARVSGNALVDEYAQIGGKASVFGNAEIFGNAQIFGKAHVYESAKAFGDCQVSGEASIFGSAQVFEAARVFGNAYMSGRAQAFGLARVFGHSQISGRARISESAKVFQDARICGDPWVKGNTKVKSYAYLYGSDWHKNPLCYPIEIAADIPDNLCVTNSKAGYSAIGYLSRPHDFWMSEEGEKLLKGWEFTDSEINECRKHVWRIMEYEKKNQKIAECVTYSKALVQKSE